MIHKRKSIAEASGLALPEGVKLDAAQQKAEKALLALLAEVNAKPRSLLSKLRSAPKAKGLYIYGEVGRGKSMLMDAFFAAVKEKKKRRVHFHAFMQEVHKRIFALREQYKKNKKEADFLPRVASAIAEEAKLLCFDEFQVKDIADAMILGRLFTLLFEAGVIVVATSNRPPEDLYKDGLKRDNFLPFIDLLKATLPIHHLGGDTDYRREKVASLDKTFISPLGKKADAFMKKLFAELSNGQKPEPETLEVNGRDLVIERTAGHIAWASFEELCSKPLGAADYLAIADAFDTLLLENIPALSSARRNEATRFITLIDTLYEKKVKLICTAEAEPEKLYAKGDNKFEFARTVSRLLEMQSTDYLR